MEHGSGRIDEEMGPTTVLMVVPRLEEFDVIKNILCGFGNLLHAETGEQGLEAIAGLNKPEELALIMAAQDLPGMEGVTFLRETLSLAPRAMRILHGRSSDPETLIRSINRARIHQYIDEGFDPKSLQGAIARFMISYRKYLNQNAYLRILEKQVEVQTANLEQRNRELEEINLTDNLTGLRNRRYLLKYLNADIARVRRDYNDWINDRAPMPPAASDLVFFMLRLDRLDDIYDIYGQAAGNGVLICLRELLGRVFREYDYLVRWSTDAFLVVARFIKRSDAPLLASRICACISNHEFLSVEGDPLPQTCSVGYASYPFLKAAPDQITWSHSVDIAEHVMYAASNSGGNTHLGIEATSEREETLSFQQIISQTSQLISSEKLELEMPTDPDLAPKKPPLFQKEAPNPAT